MIHIPFLNRKRYIVLKCYTPYKHYLEAAPITTNPKDYIRPEKHNSDYIYPDRDFSGCYSRVVSRAVSATVPLPISMRVQVEKNNIRHSFSCNCDFTRLEFAHDKDTTYPRVNDMCVSKLSLPWYLQTDTNTRFVMASHILNSTHMRVLSGVVHFNMTHSLRLFNLIPNIDMQYEVPALTPIISLYPMSDKPLHVEAYADESMCKELAIKDNHRLHYTHSYLKERKKK